MSAEAPVRVAVVGPTATGKSDFALDLIEALGEGARSSHPAVVVNADASQLYRGMDIGTAKLPVEQRRGIHHAQLDVLEVTDEASVAAYQRWAGADASKAEAGGARVVIVGGSGLYVRALTDDLVFPGTDPQVRAELSERLERVGALALWEELRRCDPDSAARIEPGNSRRVVRALEVVALTGRPFSATLPRYEDRVPTVHLALRPVVGEGPGESTTASGGADGPELAGRLAVGERIVRRAQAMFDSGLVEETAGLLERGLASGPTASRAIGYSQAQAVLAGSMSLPEAVSHTAVATRQLAARQRKWFRRDPRVHWLDVAVDAAGVVLPGAWERAVAAGVELVRG